MFVFDVGVGFGLGIDLQATDAVHTGLGGGVYHVWQLGHPSLQAADSALSGLNGHAAWLLHRSSGPMVAANHSGWLWNFAHWPGLFADPPHATNGAGCPAAIPLSQSAAAPWWNAADFDLGLQLLPVAMRVGIRPGEILDFLVGWFGFDLMGDDHGPPPRSWGVGPEPASNPSLPLSMADAMADLARMRANPMALQRPVFVLGGLLDAGFVALWASDLRRLVPEAQAAWVVPVTFATAMSLEGAVATMTTTVALACETLDWHGPVDIVAHSMGGLVARHASGVADRGGANAAQGRVSVARLFTLGTPHRGARLAELPVVHPLARRMRADSPWIRDLPTADYPILPYVLVPDQLIGPENAAPPGEVAWWLPSPPGSAAHLGALADPRFLVDIAQRLRGEAGVSSEPRAPLPTEHTER
ncbi:MAG: hypothetical protein JNK49_19975 [Planctomycetes bacterium]|nr:hypothetical protein [Planctomycetota bacterium]